MNLLIDLVLVAAGLVLWQRAASETDEVWSLFLRVLAVLDLTAITLFKGLLWIEVPLLLLALALPSVNKLEQRHNGSR